MEPIHCKSDIANAMQDLAEHCTTSQALTGRAMGEFGNVFVQGAASSSPDTLPPSLPPRILSAPPANVMCDPKVLEPQAGYSGLLAPGVKRRGMPCSDSDPSKRAKGGVTGKLLDMRTQALAAIKRACREHGTQNKTVAARWEALRMDGHVQVGSTPPDMAAWLATFKETLAHVKCPAKKDVGTWTISSAAACSHDLADVIARLDAAATSITVHVTAAEERVKRLNKQSSLSRAEHRASGHACWRLGGPAVPLRSHAFL